jgi:quercetin dioxygenase-like cupin family protein
MRILKNAAPAPSPFPGILHATLAGSEQGLRQLSVWHQVLEPGAATPPHRHDCEEVVLCTAGRGLCRFEGQEPQYFGANTTLCIPRNALHEIVNAGSEPLRMVAVFSTTPVTPHLPDGTRIDLPWAS